jgi:sulfur-oxidizing protein SoxX
MAVVAPESAWRGGARRCSTLAVAAGFVALGALAASAHAQVAAGAFTAVGDAIPAALTGANAYVADPARGHAIVRNRQIGLCLLCHSGPFPEERLQGNLATDLKGAGSRWSTGQLRLRIADSSRINAATIMPAYYKTEGLTRVAPAYHGKPVLSAEQIEDVVAFLTTLRD